MAIRFKGSCFISALREDIELSDGTRLPAGTKIAWRPQTEARLVEMDGGDLEKITMWQEGSVTDLASLFMDVREKLHRLETWAYSQGYGNIEE